jgi:protein-disulfide isomerase
MIKKIQMTSISALVLMGAMACQKSGSSSDVVQPLADNTTIVEFKGGKITAKDLKEQINPQLKSLNEEALEAYKRTAQNLAVQKILEAEAKKAGVSTPQELIEKQVSAARPVTDEEIDAFYKENKEEIERGYKDPITGKTRKVSKDELRSFLTDQGMQQARQDYVRSLIGAADMRVVLKEKTIEVPVNPESPTIGGANAKVVIHEFSDFQCPFCSRGKDVVNQLKQHYGDKVKISFRHFPLERGHPEARPAAIASECAKEQGKFWEYHDKIFDNQKDLPTKPYVAYAKEFGLDIAKFEECLQNPAVDARVTSDFTAGESIGVNSTPTFFVNGKKVAGALPFDQFKTIIDEELKK